jgi:hypothetical protein
MRYLFVFLAVFFIALNAQTQERILFLGSSSIDNWQTIKADFPEAARYAAQLTSGFSGP